MTLFKEGAELVAPRPRLNAGERRRTMELWARREATDKVRQPATELATFSAC